MNVVLICTNLTRSSSVNNITGGRMQVERGREGGMYVNTFWRAFGMLVNDIEAIRMSHR